MVELIIRTHKPEYAANDDIYGVVYLRVTKATSAKSVTIKFNGHEMYYYSDGSACIEDRSEYIHPYKLDLCDFGSSIPIGSYAVPFHKKLPLDIPGSCDINACRGLNWNIHISYTIEVSLNSDESIKDCKSIMVYQNIFHDDPGSSPLSASVTESVRGRLPFSSSDLTVNLTTGAPVYYIGENVYVTLTFDWKGSFKPQITGINIKLLNDIIIIFSQSALRRLSPHVKKGFSILNFLPWMNCRSSTVLCYEEMNYIRPLTSQEPSVVWSQSIVNPNNLSFNHGVQDLTIPLSNRLQPCTFSKHSICVYAVQAEIEFKSSKPIIITLPISGVRQKHHDWQNFDFPDWVFESQRKQSLPPFTVPDDILESDIFSRLPAFRTL